MATYYTLVVCEPGSSRWTIQFGDYRRADVAEEQREMRRDWPRGTQWKIVKSQDTQASVDAAIRQLGQVNPGKSKAKTVAVLIYVHTELARGGRTARMLCIDPEDTSVKKRLFKHYNIPVTTINDPLIIAAGSPNARFSRLVVEAVGLSEHDEQALWNFGATARRRMPIARLKQLIEAAA
jgi:hypothetical protein